jgi:hypothetical protein
MVNSDELIGTTENLTLYARCINRCRYNRVRLYFFNTSLKGYVACKTGPCYSDHQKLKIETKKLLSCYKEREDGDGNNKIIIIIMVYRSGDNSTSNSVSNSYGVEDAAHKFETSKPARSHLLQLSKGSNDWTSLTVSRFFQFSTIN